MSKPTGPKTQAPFPSRDEILEFINGSDTPVGKREIARAFHLDVDQKKLLKMMLQELERDGALQRGRGRKFAEPGSLPEVVVLQVSHFDVDGETIAGPVTWSEDDGPKPKIYMNPERRGLPALGPGDRILARIKKSPNGDYEGRTIRRLPQGPTAVLGVIQQSDDGFRVKPIDKKSKYDFHVAPANMADAGPGDLVRIEVVPTRKLGLRAAKVVEKLDRLGGPKSISLIAIHESDIPTRFSDEAFEQAEKAKAPTLEHREDIRHIPLVTIDGDDARDFDDAVYAEADDDPKNQGGFRLLVAIADVSWYVRPNTALDRDAFLRGNSTYFPDRVVPMLPEALSNGWCSLVPKEDRGCLAAEIIIDKHGNILGHKIFRGLMKSHARLTYDQVQAAHDGQVDDTTDTLVESVIKPLYEAYKCLAENRRNRGVMELDLPERRVTFDDKGEIKGIVPRVRHESHKLIEEFMIAANVAAAETLEAKKSACMYRVHAEPPRDKVEALREFLKTVDIPLAKGQVLQPGHFTRILEQAKDTPHSHLVSQVVLRSQSQALYSPENLGHFGLALRRYCHFTSPIRRYSDLLVHRSLVSSLRLGPGGLEADHKDFAEMGDHISKTERRSAVAERSAVDRFTAKFLSERKGEAFEGRITGVTRFGLFVELNESGADGLIPISTLPDDYYEHVEARHELIGRRWGRTYRMGDGVMTRLVEADPITGSTILAMLEGDDNNPQPKRQGSRPKKQSGRPMRHHRAKKKGKGPQKGPKPR